MILFNDFPVGNMNFLNNTRRFPKIINLIRKIIQEDMKVICIDFTNEYKDKFGDLTIQPVIPLLFNADISTHISEQNTDIRVNKK